MEKFKMQKVNKILTIIIVFLILIILTTVLAFNSKKSEKPVIQNETKFKSAQNIQTKEQTTFTNLGKLRATTKADKNGKSAVVIITPYIEYLADDQSFYEELDRNTKRIQNLIIEYFSLHTAQELNKKGEDSVNSELLEQINSILVLQKIKKLYFTDYLFL